MAVRLAGTNSVEEASGSVNTPPASPAEGSAQVDHSGPQLQPAGAALQRSWSSTSPVPDPGNSGNNIERVGGTGGGVGGEENEISAPPPRPDGAADAAETAVRRMARRAMPPGANGLSFDVSDSTMCAPGGSDGRRLFRATSDSGRWKLRSRPRRLRDYVGRVRRATWSRAKGESATSPCTFNPARSSTPRASRTIATEGRVWVTDRTFSMKIPRPREASTARAFSTKMAAWFRWATSWYSRSTRPTSARYRSGSWASARIGYRFERRRASARSGANEVGLFSMT